MTATQLELVHYDAVGFHVVEDETEWKTCSPIISRKLLPLQNASACPSVSLDRGDWWAEAYMIGL